MNNLSHRMLFRAHGSLTVIATGRPELSLRSINVTRTPAATTGVTSSNALIIAGVGTAVGGLLFIAGVIALVILLPRRRRRHLRKQQKTEQPERYVEEDALGLFTAVAVPVPRSRSSSVTTNHPYLKQQSVTSVTVRPASRKDSFSTDRSLHQPHDRTHVIAIAKSRKSSFNTDRPLPRIPWESVAKSAFRSGRRAPSPPESDVEDDEADPAGPPATCSSPLGDKFFGVAAPHFSARFSLSAGGVTQLTHPASPYKPWASPKPTTLSSKDGALMPGTPLVQHPAPVKQFSRPW